METIYSYFIYTFALVKIQTSYHGLQGHAGSESYLSTFISLPPPLAHYTSSHTGLSLPLIHSALPQLLSFACCSLDCSSTCSSTANSLITFKSQLNVTSSDRIFLPPPYFISTLFGLFIPDHNFQLF